MSQPKRDGKRLLGVAAVLWLLYQIFKKPTSEVTYYRCPNPDCQALVKPNTEYCQSCGIRIDWTVHNPSKGVASEHKAKFFATKIIGLALLFSLAMLALFGFCKPEMCSTWTHLITLFGGYLAGSGVQIYKPGM